MYLSHSKIRLSRIMTDNEVEHSGGSRTGREMSAIGVSQFNALLCCSEVFVKLNNGTPDIWSHLFCLLLHTPNNNQGVEF